MRINRIRIANFKGVTASEVVFDETGVTIVEGDNEAGKTSLLEALDFLFEYKSDSRHRRVVAAQPVGLDVGPEAEAELTVGGTRLTIRKRWIKAHETNLVIHGSPDQQLTGHEAHNHLQVILDQHLDRDLFAALRLAQGTELAQAGLANRTLSGALDAAVGKDVAGEREDSLWDAIAAERFRYWTATGNASTDRRKLTESLESARADLAGLTEQANQLENDIEKLRRLAVLIAELEERQGNQTAGVDELRNDMARISEIRKALREGEAELRVKEGELLLAQERVNQRQQLIDGLAERQLQLTDAQSAGTASDTALTELATREIELTTARDGAVAALAAARDVHKAAADDRDLTRDLIDLELLEERLTKLDDAQQRLIEAEQGIDQAKIDTDLLSDIEHAYEQFLIANASAAEYAVALSIEALSNIEVTGTHLDGTLEAGSVTEFVTGDPVELTIPGQLRINLHPGAGAGDTQHQKATASEKLQRLLEQAGVDDVAAARTAETDRQAAISAAQERSVEIKGLLRDLTQESLAAKVERLGNSTSSAQAARPVDRPLPADLDTAEESLAGAADVVGQAEATHEAATSALEDLRLLKSAAEIKQSREAADLQQAGREVDKAGAALEEARKECPDEELTANLQTVNDQAVKAQEVVDAANARLAELNAESTEELFNNAAAALERTKGELRAADSDYTQLSISLRLRGEEGIAGAIDEAARLVEQLANEHSRLEAKAEAAMLLHATFERHRALARERYAAPLRQEVERLGRLVFGEDVGIELDDDLRITSRHLDNTTIPFDQLSVGAQEQLGLLARLACASLVGVDDNEGAPVILDDALGWTDPERVERMGAAINATGRQAQVIILTCTPKRYAAVGNATVVRLHNVTKESAPAGE